ncbi:hypothetical protein [Dethiothermospora halolimnae]|uniref:hypothetical protein n=1 Tax=Dethiothermospora halolimnae TaxID=3114390 RepID=UPI003CCB94A5
MDNKIKHFQGPKIKIMELSFIFYVIKVDKLNEFIENLQVNKGYKVKNESFKAKFLIK